MRYLWDLYPAYIHDWTASAWKRALIGPMSSYLRLWDYASAARVDTFVANSQNVQRRIWKAYRRQSEVIYPPVEIESFYGGDSEDYYLVVSELVAYKRISDAVRCLGRMGRPLKIVGDGPEFKNLRKLAGPEAEFCGRVSASELRKLYSRCRAVLMPGEEDFGIVPVEAMASGKPVIALGCGGVLESVPERNPRAGFFYDSPGDQALEAAIRRFEREEKSLSATAIQTAAARFSEARFQAEMRSLIGAQRDQSEKFPGVAQFTKA
jgi:glycosyltransferase involved in cell wall biosynthesis